MARKTINPFVCQGYISPDYFCDRIEETEKISSMLSNGQNITLISPRRLGKTGLICHTFNRIKSKNKDAVCIYTDIFPTKNQSELARTLGEAVLNESMSKSRQLGKKALEFLGALRPVIGIDPLTNTPNITLSVNPTTSEVTLRRIFDYMKKQPKEFFVAIDEFQQITYYPETGTEALLRSHIQFAPNVHFIFSGSKQHLMSEMFISPQKPFYQSTELLNLTPLEEQTYYNFANHFFTARGGLLNNEVFHTLYTEFDGYTWYIQTVLNRLYETYKKVDNIMQMKETLLSIIESKAAQYESLVQFLTNNQFSLLRAIANEEKVEQPLGKEFIKKYNLTSTSSVQTSLDMLTEKELVYRQTDGYMVYDQFLAHWLRRI